MLSVLKSRDTRYEPLRLLGILRLQCPGCRLGWFLYNCVIAPAQNDRPVSGPVSLAFLDHLCLNLRIVFRRNLKQLQSLR